MPIRFITPKINVDVNRRPIKPERLVKRPKIVKKDSKGNIVKDVMRPKVFMGVDEKSGREIFAYPKLVCPVCNGNKELEKPCDFCHGTGEIAFFTNYEKVLTVKGEEISSEEIEYWAINEDGKEEQTSKFPRSEVLKVQIEMPRSKLHEFYFDGGWDEIESPTKKKKGEKIHDKFVEQELYKEAERYVAKGIIGAGKFVKTESFREWFFVCFPTILDNGKFGWLVGYTTCKIEQTHLMDVPRGKEVAAEQKIPAKSYLPDLKALAK